MREFVGVVVRVGGIGMYKGVGKSGELAQEVVFGVVGDPVGLGQSEFWIDVEFDFGVEVVPDPPQPQLRDAADAVRLSECALGCGDQHRVDGIK